jgi:hypothetical protein
VLLLVCLSVSVVGGDVQLEMSHTVAHVQDATLEQRAQLRDDLHAGLVVRQTQHTQGGAVSHGVDEGLAAHRADVVGAQIEMSQRFAQFNRLQCNKLQAQIINLL